MGDQQPRQQHNFQLHPQATELWAWPKRTDWIEFLQEYKVSLITDYPSRSSWTGGGSREGIGYGTAQTRLWANARTWAMPPASTHGCRVAHASVGLLDPRDGAHLDYYAPFGDLSRESALNLYDYQEPVREGGRGLHPAADRALWWIRAQLRTRRQRPTATCAARSSPSARRPSRPPSCTTRRASVAVRPHLLAARSDLAGDDRGPV